MLIVDLAFQLIQMTLVIALAPLLTGVTRKVKARLTRRRGASVLQPYRDLYRLVRKEAIVADSATWLFRFAPYIVFASTWVAAALVPTFATGLLFSWSADLIAIVALLGVGRFFLALAGMDVGTAFGGLGASRESMFATLAEPAMLTTVFSLALIAGSASVANIDSRLAPRPPNAVPTSMPASARKNRPTPSSASIAIRSADQENSSPVAKVGTSAAATQVEANTM